MLLYNSTVHSLFVRSMRDEEENNVFDPDIRSQNFFHDRHQREWRDRL
jgi:hypothetical protein